MQSTVIANLEIRISEIILLNVKRSYLIVDKYKFFKCYRSIANVFHSAVEKSCFSEHCGHVSGVVEVKIWSWKVSFQENRISGVALEMRGQGGPCVI